MGGKVTQVVHLDKVEVVRAPYQIRPLMGSFNPLFISLSTALSGSARAGFFSTLIRH